MKHHRTHRKGHRKSQRKSRRATRRRRSCAAQPYNTQLLQQRGGMAPFAAPGLLLNQPTLVQAETQAQITAIEQATAMAKAQQGGYRRRRKSQRRRHQRGGMSPFETAFAAPKVQPYGANPQFTTESSVNSLYTGAGIKQLTPAA